MIANAVSVPPRYDSFGEVVRRDFRHVLRSARSYRADAVRAAGASIETKKTKPLNPRNMRLLFEEDV